MKQKRLKYFSNDVGNLILTFQIDARNIRLVLKLAAKVIFHVISILILKLWEKNNFFNELRINLELF